MNKKRLLMIVLVSANMAFANTTPVNTANNCLDGQDLSAEDVDISNCPALPNIPNSILVGSTNIDLGAWELGQTEEGEVYKYGELINSADEDRILVYSGGQTVVNAENLSCWAKGYYRLRAILQSPPSNYLKLISAGFQYRFFQFQTDLRNGSTGYTQISSYMDHLVKWVTVIDREGKCIQPTLDKFENYLAQELERREIE